MKKMVSAMLLAISALPWSRAAVTSEWTMAEIDAGVAAAIDATNRLDRLEDRANAWDAAATQVDYNTINIETLYSQSVLKSADNWAAVSNVVGSVRLVSGGVRTSYASFTNAYAHASVGDTVELSPGVFDLGAITFAFNKAVSISGFGSAATIIRANGGFTWDATATNCMLSGVTLRNITGDTGDFVFFNNTVSSIMNVVWDDVFCDNYGNTDHTLEVSGANIELNRVRTHCRLGSNAFVLKGCSNVVVRGCSTEIDAAATSIGLYLKSHTTQKGNLSNVTVDGFTASRSYCFLDIGDNNSNMQNVLIKNLRLQNVAGNYAVILGSQTGTATGNWAKNITIDGVVANSGETLFTQADCAVTNIAMRNCTLYSSDVLPEYLPCVWDALGGTHNRTVEQNITLYYPDGGYYASEGYSKKMPNLSNGAFYTNVVTADVTTTGMWICVQAGYEFKAAELVVGDPVLLEGGSYDGVYRLMNFGTVTATDVPTPGAVIGDYYIRVSGYNMVTPASNVNCGNVWMGKLGWRIAGYNTSIGSAYGTVEGGAGAWGHLGVYPAAISNSREAFSYGIAYGGTEQLSRTALDSIAGAYINSKVRVFAYRDNYASTATDTFYAGLFASSSGNNTYTPLSLSHSWMTMRKVPTNGGFPCVYDLGILPASP